MMQYAQLGNIDWKDSLIMQLLNCGYNDINRLEHVSYDIGEIVDELVADGIRPTIDSIMMDVFALAANDFMEAVDAMLETFNDYEDDDYSEEESELKEILDNISNDTSEYVGIDVSGLYVKDIGRLRELGFSEELENIEYLMGEPIKNKNW